MAAQPIYDSVFARELHFVPSVLRGRDIHVCRLCADVPCPSDVVLEIPNRDPRLPRFYVLTSHSKVDPALEYRRILLALQDLRPEAMGKIDKSLLELRLPDDMDKSLTDTGESAALVHGDIARTYDVGFVRIGPGDVLTNPLQPSPHSIRLGASPGCRQ